jgi:exodeoxyribonuclease V
MSLLAERLNEDQKKIHDYVINDFMKSNDKFITIGGYAGTGKTFLITAIGQSLQNLRPMISIAYCSFTGKAASVLSAYLERENISLNASTIHSMMYRPIFDNDKPSGKKVIVGWKKIDHLGHDLIIIDEASMVNKDIWNDLLSYRIKLIVVGDNFQLPPIGDDKFNLMRNCTFKMTEIQRQAETSAIIGLSKFIRQNGYVPANRKFSDTVFKSSWNNPQCKQFFSNLDLSKKHITVLCGFNKTRCQINKNYRNKIKFDEEMIYAGDKVVCLRNNHSTGIRNGHQGIVMMVLPHSKHFYKTILEVNDFPEFYDSFAYKHSFGKETYDDIYEDKSLTSKKGNYDVFDYAYAISVHKAQASEWDSVVLIEQRSKYWDDEYYARWLYTGVTRAKNSLFIISDCWDF